MSKQKQKQNQKQKSHTLTFDGFRGMDYRLMRTNNQVAADTFNFRILSNGSLEKRPGYRILADLGNTIRAFYTSMANGRSVIYVLVKSSFYSVDLFTGNKSLLGTVTTTSGNACIFSFNSVLYLMDGVDCYVYRGNGLSLVGGYVPLIGKDWTNNYVGEPYEPKNILTRRARISYVVSHDAPSIFMCTGEPVESVQAVYRNGILLDPADYYIDEEFETINVKGSDAGDRLEIYMTMKNSSAELLSFFLSCTRSIMFGGTNNHRLFFWGGRDSARIFCTSYVTAAQKAASAKHNVANNDFYVPEGYQFSVGSGGAAVQGCACHYDRLLIFTETDTWMATHNASGLDEFSLTPINLEIGCAAPDGVASVGNHPISLGRHSLYQWYQESDVINRCNARRVSEEIDGFLLPQDYANSALYYNLYQNELWFYNKETGVVWIRNLSNGYWYQFFGIYADRFFDADGRVGFVKGSLLYVFDDTRYYDQDSPTTTQSIHASYSVFSDFGTDDSKNLARLSLHCETGGGEMYFAFLEDGVKDLFYPLFSNVPPTYLQINQRITSGRFRFGKITLSAPGGGRPIVHSMTLQTR